MKTEPTIEDLLKQRVEHSQEMIRLDIEISKLRKKELAKHVGTIVRVEDFGVCKITKMCGKFGWLGGYYINDHAVRFSSYLSFDPSAVKPCSPKLWEKQVRKAIAHLEKLI